jgi:hypothetical protein
MDQNFVGIIQRYTRSELDAGALAKGYVTLLGFAYENTPLAKANELPLFHRSHEQPQFKVARLKFTWRGQSKSSCSSAA